MAIFFNFGNITPKLAHIVLINDTNNMCEGISKNLNIEHKQKKCKISQVIYAAYKKWCISDEHR